MKKIRFDNSWGYYREAPRNVGDGIKAKSVRGEIGETWWSKRWVDVLKSFNIGERLSRGRSYARRGQVMSIDVAPGKVTARVQGSMAKPYDIKIELATLSDTEWERVADTMAARAIFAAKLLAGEMPANIEEAFSDAHVSLFPARESDLKTDCSCPDWSNPCKHIAAVYYILAERFDEDPFLLFKLRGHTKEQIISGLRARRTAHAAKKPDTAATPAAPPVPLPATSDFWKAGAGLERFHVHIPPVQAGAKSAVLMQLGEAPFALDAEALAQAYATVARAAAAKALDE